MDRPGEPERPSRRAGRTLVTGATGFAGSHLVELLLEMGEDVAGLSRQSSWPTDMSAEARTTPLEHIALDDDRGIRDVLCRYRPTTIYHLAGQPNVPASVRDPKATWRANFDGVKRLLDAVVDLLPESTVLIVGTGAVYGSPAESELPIRETTPIEPENPYAESKAAADRYAIELAERTGSRIVLARPFNHIGPRQTPDFALAHFGRQIAIQELRARGGEPVEPLMVGRLDVERDFTDVRDVVRAYVAIADHGGAAELFNIASGQSARVGDLLEELLRLAETPISVTESSDLIRGRDYSVVRVDPGRIRERTGWRPRIPRSISLADTLAYWRRRVASDSRSPS